MQRVASLGGRGSTGEAGNFHRRRASAERGGVHHELAAQEVVARARRVQRAAAAVVRRIDVRAVLEQLGEPAGRAVGARGLQLVQHVAAAGVGPAARARADRLVAPS